MSETALERNAPCWCGSGKKYKKCHWQADLEKNGANIHPVAQRHSMVKTPEEREGMRRAGVFNGQLMDYIRSFVKAGISTGELDILAHDYTLAHGHTPACLNYQGYPKSICTSVNNVVCHGIPSPEEVLKDGDIVNVDFTSIVDGFYGDSSETFFIGNVSDKARHLVKVTARALLLGIRAAQPGRPLSAIAEAIEPYVKSQGCSVVRQYTGHGIGRAIHEYFNVFHHIASDSDKIILEPGLTFTVEPMVNLGSYHVITDSIDKWTVRTRDGSLSAQFEHTILITGSKPEILTLTPSQRQAGKILVVAGIEEEFIL
ncbi:MAG: type I methionyl aminopeptidase [Chitinivibrionales bacterium]